MEKTICSIEELKNLSPLREVPEDQLQWLLECGQFREVAEGDILLDVGDPVETTSFLLDGRCILYFHQGNHLNEIKPVERGHIIGYLPYSRVVSSIVRVLCIHPGSLLVVPAHKILEATKHYYELTAALVHFMISRIRFATTQQQQMEKMLALGKLSAGLAHELNNPAAAIISNASILTGLFADIPQLFDRSASLSLNGAQTSRIRVLLKNILSREQKGPLTMMQAAEIEEELESWLIDHGIDDLSIAETMVSAGFTKADLEAIVQELGSIQVTMVLSWLNYHLTTDCISNEIKEASSRISKLVGAVKSFSHMDRGNDKELIDVHTGIESTLTLMEYKLKNSRVAVTRRYTPDLPHVPVFPGQINQVWTNLIDNAIDAMSVNGYGTLTITTGKDRNSVVVTIQDDGPGIPAEVLPSIFDPFFTTKAVGQGAGIGLEVVCRVIEQHDGHIAVDPAPGYTCFRVSLPL